MRIMIDTNVLISTIIFPSNRLLSMLNYITNNHTLVISSYVIDEFYEVVERKFPTKKYRADVTLSRMLFEEAYTPRTLEKDLFYIRDVADYPVLYTAIMDGSDILITGDKDFSNVDVEKPTILTPSEFISQYVDTESQLD
jgi:putative PIN family toxin of toxin-antitoxin system